MDGTEFNEEGNSVDPQGADTQPLNEPINDDHDSDGGEPSGNTGNTVLSRYEQFQQKMANPSDENDDSTDTDNADKPDEIIDKPDDKPDSDEIDKPNRASAYKQQQQELTDLRTQAETTNATLERYGGIEGFTEIAGILDAFVTPAAMFTETTVGPNGEQIETKISGFDKINEFLLSTPGGEKVFSDIFFKGLESEPNRVTAFNDIIHTPDFGLRSDVNLNQDQINTVMDFVATKLNLARTPEEVNNFFDELKSELTATDFDKKEFAKDQEIAQLRAQLAAKNGTATGDKTADEDNSPEAIFDRQLKDEEEKFVKKENFLISTYDNVVREVLAPIGLTVTDKDKEPMKVAKTTLIDLILGRNSMASIMRGSSAFQTAVGFVEKNTEKSALGRINLSNLNTATAVNINTVLKKLAPLLNAKVSNGNGNGIPATPQPQGDITSSNPNPGKQDFASKAEETLGRKFR